MPELDEQRALDGDIDCHATRLIELCNRLQWETNASSTIEVVIGAIVTAAGDLYDDEPRSVYEGIVTALVKILGADKVLAAIDQAKQ